MGFIDAKEVKLQVMLSNAQEAYKVPLYQRPYAWGRNQWEDLLEDIKMLSSNDVHFFGSIVVVPEGEHRLGVNYFQVVDGQQRMATILIWLSVLRDIAKGEGNSDLAKHIEETFLFAREWESGKQKMVPKLELGKLDNDAFQRILKGERKDWSHLIFECYNFFKKNTNASDIWRTLLNNVSVVHINAFNYFNAFRLFETLNDRGLELSAADLIKNFILMKVSAREEIFNETINEWNEMYDKVRDKDPVKFIRRHLLGTHRGKISESRLYEEVRKKLENGKDEEIRDFTKNLNVSATVYKKIIETTFAHDKINETLRFLHLVEVAPSFTLLLKVFPYWEKKEISDEDILEIMKMIETFHIRWGVCDQSTSRLDQIYNEICIDLSNNQHSELKDSIKEKLTKYINNVNDEIFKSNFSSRDFKPGESRTKYILWKLSEPTGETILNLKEIHTEHIMPRALSNDWIEYLIKQTGKNEKEIKALHQDNHNRIGNLVIIKGEWNQSMSNRLFDEKKKDLEKSEFIITKELKDYDKWTFDEINKRCEELAKKSLEVWKLE